MSQESENKGVEILNKLYELAINGLPKTKTAQELAMEYLEHSNGDAKKAAEKLVVAQISKCTTTGFLTGLGGLITLPITLPADMTSALYIQIRMIAAIAVMGGYDLHDDAVQTMVYSVLLKLQMTNILKQIGVKTGNKIAMNALKKLPGKVLFAINRKMGFRFITKFGQKGTVNLVKAVPVVGGFVNGGINLAETKMIANRAIKEFLTNEVVDEIQEPIDFENLDVIDIELCEDDSETTDK